MTAVAAVSGPRTWRFAGPLTPVRIYVDDSGDRWRITALEQDAGGRYVGIHSAAGAMCPSAYVFRHLGTGERRFYERRAMDETGWADADVAAWFDRATPIAPRASA